MTIDDFQIGALADEVTPELSDHARERCAEMRISTKVAKRIWRHRTTVYDTPETGRVIVLAESEPGYAIVVRLRRGRPLVVTVVFNVEETYVRQGATFRVSEEAA